MPVHRLTQDEIAQQMAIREYMRLRRRDLSDDRPRGDKSWTASDEIIEPSSRDEGEFYPRYSQEQVQKIALYSQLREESIRAVREPLWRRMKLPPAETVRPEPHTMGAELFAQPPPQPSRQSRQYQKPKVEPWPAGWPPPWFHEDDLELCSLWVSREPDKLDDDTKAAIDALCTAMGEGRYGKPMRSAEAQRIRSRYRSGERVRRELIVKIKQENPELLERRREYVIEALRKAEISPRARKRAIRAVKVKKAEGEERYTAVHKLGKDAWQFLNAWRAIPGAWDAEFEWWMFANGREHIGDRTGPRYFLLMLGKGRGKASRRGRPSELPAAIVDWFKAELLRQEAKLGRAPRRSGQTWIHRLSPAEKEAIKVCAIPPERALELLRMIRKNDHR